MSDFYNETHYNMRINNINKQENKKICSKTKKVIFNSYANKKKSNKLDFMEVKIQKQFNFDQNLNNSNKKEDIQYLD